MRIVITGGAGFIGSNLVRYLLEEIGAFVLNIDKLCFPGSVNTLRAIAPSPRHIFVERDICDTRALSEQLQAFGPDAIIHLAAESHVDRSIDSPEPFIRSNIVGTFSVLEAARGYWRQLEAEKAAHFRLLHVSTDEVLGSLGAGDPAFREADPYRPSSPYAASKASSDHLVRSWRHTYGLPTVITNCSNNYGPFQFPEKLIPLAITNALSSRAIPVYGTGRNVRDWLYVEDHVRALHTVLTQGCVGESYHIGGACERTNTDVVTGVCDLLDEMLPKSQNVPHRQLIRYVADRPGHDFRYALNTAKIRSELRWSPSEDFESGLRKTVAWYIHNRDWCHKVMGNTYGGERLGLGAALRSANG